MTQLALLPAPTLKVKKSDFQDCRVIFSHCAYRFRISGSSYEETVKLVLWLLYNCPAYSPKAIGEQLNKIIWEITENDENKWLYDNWLQIERENLSVFEILREFGFYMAKEAEMTCEEVAGWAVETDCAELMTVILEYIITGQPKLGIKVK